MVVIEHPRLIWHILNIIIIIGGIPNGFGRFASAVDGHETVLANRNNSTLGCGREWSRTCGDHKLLNAVIVTRYTYDPVAHINHGCLAIEVNAPMMLYTNCV